MSYEVFKNYVAAMQRYQEAEASYYDARNAVLALTTTHGERAVVVGDDVVVFSINGARIVPLLAL